MKTLVIHPLDNTTEFLSKIYKDKDWSIIRHNVSKKDLKSAIKEHDRIIMLGHGLPQGLLGFNRFIIDSKIVYLLREKDCVCIWCNANDFVKKYGLNGFNTGMFISEIDESFHYNVMTNYEQIKHSNELFAELISKHIDSDNVVELVKDGYKPNNSLMTYNRERFFYEKK